MLNSKTLRSLVTLAVAISMTFVVACDDDDDGPVAVVSSSKVVFNFDNWIGAGATTPAEINELSLQYTNPFGMAYSLATLRYIVSDVRLHTAGGETVGMDGVHYRDQSDPTTRSLTIQDIPHEEYTKVSFTFGVDEFKNIRGMFAGIGVEFENEMAWPMGLGADVGYHYLKIEGNYESTPNEIPPSAFTTHTGARHCDGPCGPLGDVTDPVIHHHYFRVELDIPETHVHAGETLTISINMDVNGWYEDVVADAVDTDHNWNNLGMQLIMANLPEQEKLMTNGPNCFTAVVKSE